MATVAKKRVGVLRGGTGKNYHASLKKGGQVISHIFENLPEKYKTFDILIDKDHIWHLNGIPVSPSSLINKIDVAWNTAHPSLSNILDSLGIPNVRAGGFSSALEESRDMLREHMRRLGVKMPRAVLIPPYLEGMDGPRERYAIKKAKSVHEKFGAPWIVKSFSEDKSMGIHVAKTFNALVAGIEDGVARGDSVLVEEFVEGKPGAVHSLPGFRGEEVYVLPPQGFIAEEKNKIISFVRDLHRHLDAKHYLKTDLILHPKRGFFVTAISLSPDLRPDSHLAQSAVEVGATLDHVVEHLLERA